MTEHAPYPIRPIEENELDSFIRVDEHAFNSSPWSDGDRQGAIDRFEFDRTLAAFDGTTPVGSTMCYSFQLSGPGQDTLPAAGVTFRSVSPPHRRRGGRGGGAGRGGGRLAGDASGPRGYARYAGVDTWADFLPDNVLTVRELMAADPAASAALCTDLLSRDLTTEFRLPRRPVDDPLLYQLADPRRARPHLNDNVWVRIGALPRSL